MHARLRDLRKLLPPRGPAYELFDCSVFLFALGLIGYVILKPTEVQVDALRAPLIFITETQLGYAMIAAAALGVVTSYTRWLRVGYIATITMTMTLAANYFVGLWSVGGTDSLRVLLSALLYGWIARRLLTEQPPRVDA